MAGQRALLAAETGCLRAAVIGAGSMGAGIAAQFANAGIAVDLLDIPAPSNRNARAEAGIANQIAARGFMGADQARLVQPGNVEDDLDRLTQANWIIEAVVENLDIKRALFDKIEALRKPDAIVSSNTSTIPRARLIEGRSQGFARHFLISHFFNPPRYMELLELVGEAGSPAWDFAQRAGRDVLGKTVIACLDTPGFVANRIGCTWISVSIVEAIRLGLTVEQADAVQTVFGVPQTGVFGLMDLVGIDLIPGIWGSLMTALPGDDTINRFDLPGQGAVKALIGAGHHGRKSGAGFYRKVAAGREACDLAAGTYRALQPVAVRDLPGGGDASALLASDGSLGDYARSVMGATLRYVADHAPAIALDGADVDTAMELGYAWKRGPFKLIDSLGAGLGVVAAPRKGAVQAAAQNRLQRAKAGAGRVAGNDDASIWDIGDGLIALELHTKMNAVGSGVLDVVDAAVDRLNGAAMGMVIGNENPRAFSAGANLAAVMAMIEAGDWAGIEAYTARGQALYAAMRHAPAPVVAAVMGVALGGGCEMILHCDDAVLHAEAQVGLPEATLGLLPGWGGCTRTLARAMAQPVAGRGPAAAAQATLAVLLAKRPFGSVREAIGAGLLPASVGIAMARGSVFDLAVTRVATIVDGYAPPAPQVFRNAGPSAAAGLIAKLQGRHLAGALAAEDLAVAERIVDVLTGGPGADPQREMSEADMLALERAAFVALAATPVARARIAKLL